MCSGYVGTVLVIEGLRIANHSSINITDNDSINCMLPQEHWKFTTALTISAIAAISSYCLMTFVILIPVNIIRCYSKESDLNKRDSNKSDDDSEECCCSPSYCISYKKALNDNVLSPFNDNDKDNDESSNLSIIQTWYFYTNYLVVILLFICSFVSSIVYAVSDTIYDCGYCWIDYLYLTMIVLQLISQFCAIQSCFIFSKIVYKVTNKLDKLAEKMDQINKETAIRVSSKGNIAELINAYDKGKEWIDRAFFRATEI